MLDSQSESQIELIDFGSEIPPARLSYIERIAHGGIVVTRCVLRPNPGSMIGASQFTVTMHESKPLELEWRLPENSRMERRRIVAGEFHINSADRPIFLRWTDSPQALVVALEQRFIEQVVSDAFDGNTPALRTVIGTRDPVMEGMAAAWRKALAERSACSRLYAEGLGLALSVHLFRTYGDGLNRPRPMVGGLGALRLRRVVDYIEAHLVEDISLGDLAALAGLSTHHFGEAFKATTGTSPHRYLIERRLRRAKELLLGAEQSIAEIAVSVGFASHSHFTDNFRRLTGTTPSRFRIDRS